MGELLEGARRLLSEAGIDNAAWESETLLQELMGLNRGEILLHSREPVPPGVAWAFAGLVARRSAREPLQHLLGHWPFLELDLRVDSRALIPRPETEDLVLAARELLPSHRPTQVVDVGTGGGCIGLALAHSHPRARILGLDLDPRALTLAADNILRTGYQDRVNLARGDLLEALSTESRFDLVVANLPYVAPAEFPGLQPEVRLFEPPHALQAGEGGMALIRRLAAQAPSRLAPGGWLLMEMAPGQAGILADELYREGWKKVTIRQDRFEKPRMVASQIGS